MPLTLKIRNSPSFYSDKAFYAFNPLSRKLFLLYQINQKHYFYGYANNTQQSKRFYGKTSGE